MGRNSKIAWTDHTFNPWWGCEKIRAGCAHCYAGPFAARWGHSCWGAKGKRRFFGDEHWNEPLAWNAAAAKNMAPGPSPLTSRPKVFCGSMCDVMEDRPDLLIPRARLFDVIVRTPNLDWLLCTKRPENYDRFLPRLWTGREGVPRNVWLLATVELQQYLVPAVRVLAAISPIVAGLSIEPMLGPIDLRPALGYIDWVIVGGESGAVGKARPCNVAWIVSIVQQCVAAGVACFVKQLGSNAIEIDRDRLGQIGEADDPAAWADSCKSQILTDDPKGADPAEWPAALRVQQFPTPPSTHIPGGTP